VRQAPAEIDQMMVTQFMPDVHATGAKVNVFAKSSLAMKSHGSVKSP
jgi:hypothetical protein